VLCDEDATQEAGLLSFWRLVLFRLKAPVRWCGPVVPAGLRPALRGRVPIACAHSAPFKPIALTPPAPAIRAERPHAHRRAQGLEPPEARTLQETAV